MNRLLFGMCLLSSLAAGQGLEYVRANYTKYEYRVAMRDGVRLFCSVCIPKDRTKTYPIMLSRTPYSVGPYGVDQYRGSLGPSELFAKDGFIFVNEDVRGRFMSEGTFSEVRPHNPVKRGPKDIDESTDTWDTIDWLIKNLPANNGKVGLSGISYPGFYSTAGAINAHPALVAVSPQAPVTDYYLGDDSYHNGAFMLAANFGFYTNFVERKGDPAPPRPGRNPFEFGTPDGYDFFLRMGSLAEGNERFFQNQNVYWNEQIYHPNYDEFWQSRSIWKHLKAIKPAMLTVGGWFDAEDLQGPLRVFDSIQRMSPATENHLVMGPWTHGSWARGDGLRVGNVDFGSKTAEYYREKIEFAFFSHHLKGKKDIALPKVWMFETGTNQWRTHDTWPPKSATERKLYLRENGTLAWEAGGGVAFDEYSSDPKKPVPYVGHTVMGMARDYMTEDQRFASQRPDVLHYQDAVLEEDLTLAGPITATLYVSSTGTDSDFVVKVIDVYPGDFPSGEIKQPAPANYVRMGGYQQLVRGEPFRARFRNSFEKPEALTPGKVTKIEFVLPDIYHTFRRGHRIAVQIQSSWFPLTDRNPQKFVDIPNAKTADFQKATQRVYRGGSTPTTLTVRVSTER